MPLSVGERLGPYEILAPIGSGGMGEVYRARDTKLKRDVALKVLPEAFARDPERMARFQREAEVLASLNHPNIAAIYGVEGRALVMEMVEGETLAGPLPLETVVDYFKQIAGALEYAHERGVVHRDLKPANIKITPEGVVKLLDFGLAKAVSLDTASESAGNSPTLSIGVTVAGVILGTAAYMAPEQARGLKVDKRIDIWAFGAVLYEMLADSQLFAGETVTDILAAVVTRDPDWKPIPANFQRLLRRCLERDPKRRLRDIGDAMPLLEDLPGAAEVPRPLEAPRKVWPWALGTGVLGAALLALATIHFRETPPEQHAVLSTIALPEKMSPSSPAISPDGRKLAFIAAGADFKPQLWVRSLDASTAQPLAGTTGAAFPFWSADSRSLGFFANGKLRKIEVAGGPALTLADASGGRGGTWNQDGVILFAPGPAVPLERVSAGGGSSSSATKFLGGEETHRWPWFLPDGRHFLYVAGRLAEPIVTIHLGDLASPEDKTIGEADSNAIYSQVGSAGRLLFMRDSTLMAQPFDPKRLAATGEPVPALEQIRVSGTALGEFSASGNGLLVYQTGGPVGSNLMWFDRTGKRVRTLGEPSDYVSFRISPDGRRVAMAVRSAGGKSDIWLMDGERGVATRLTSNGVSEDPIWSPDGRSIVFASGSPVNLFLKESSGGGDERRLSQSPRIQYPNDWSRDGRVVVYDETVPGAASKHQTGSRQNDLWFLPMNPEGGALAPKPYLKTPFDEWEARFSPEPNPRWVAYRSNESGRYEVYVQSFPEPRNKTRISTGGGSFVAWGAGGREIFYVSPEGKLMVVSLKPRGDSVQPSAPQELFALPSAQGNSYPYDITPDGQRFLVRVPADQAARPLNLLMNWPAPVK